MQTVLDTTRRALDPYQPIALSSSHGDRYLRINEARCRQQWEWEDLYIIEMEAVEMPTSSAFDIAVVFHWELLSDTEETPPSAQRLFAIARQLAREHFNASRCPRVCGQQWGIVIHYPPVEDLATD